MRWCAILLLGWLAPGCNTVNDLERGGCFSSSECGTGRTCTNGRCTVQCHLDNDCDGGRCEFQRCVAAPLALPDGTVDAAPADAARPDMRIADAAPDMRVVDMTLPDMRVVDAAAPDMRVVDAAPDMRAVDAAPDAAAPDMAAPDMAADGAR